MVRKKRAGLFMDSDMYYNNELYRGAYEACLENDLELVVFFGGCLGYNQSSRNVMTDYQRPVIYQYANCVDIDFILVPTTGICQGNVRLQKQFIDYFKVPTISLNSPVGGHSTIIFDNLSGVKEAVDYMIRCGQRKNIGMISGFKGNHGSELRVQGYREALRENDLDVIDDNILYCPDYSRYNNQIIGEYLDNHPALDAIMCATDSLAFCLYTELDKRDIKIGKEILVSGFDDSVQGSSLVPALASVHADAAMLSYLAVQHSLNQLKTGKIFDERVVTNFIPRMSVGYNVHNETDLYQFVKHCKECHEDSKYIALGICEYIFINRLFSNNIKDKVSDLICFIIDNIRGDFQDSKLNSELIRLMNKVFIYDNIQFIDLDKILISISILLDIEGEETEDIHLRQTFYNHIYNQIVNCFNAVIAKQTIEINQQLLSINTINKETMIISNNKYEALEDNLLKMGIKNAQLYFYLTVRTNYDYDFKLDDKMIMGVCIKNGKRVPCHNVIVETKDVIESLNSNYKVLSSIYFNEYQYGIIVCDIPCNKISQLEYISTQFGTSLNANYLLNTLNEISITDELTKLYNRRGLLKKINEINLHHDNKIYYLLLADLDRLKQINDNYGHEQGDNAIKRARDILKTIFPINSYICRLGGDEFVVLFSDVDSKFIVDFDNTMKDVTKSINDRYNYPYYVSLSYGISVYNQESSLDLKKMIDNADALMYEHKR